MTTLRIDVIKTDGGTQPRGQLDFNVITDYAEAMAGGATFPPVVVFYDGSIYWLADGYHRINASRQNGLVEIEAEVRQGTQRDAVLFACGANADHGMRRTIDDKRRAVLTLLNDPEWRRWSDREIAKQCHVTHPFVGGLRVIGGNVTTNNTVKFQRSDGKTWEQPREKGTQRTECTPFPEADGAFITKPQGSVTRRTFNRTNDNIEWATWTWNPVTGCKMGCPYCYARDIANRFYAEKFEPTFHPERLADPHKTPLPALSSERGVFVCSMADLFGEWVPQDWINQVIEAVRNAPGWTFIFLSKNPRRMVGIDWPDNSWVGTTVDIQARVKPAEEAFKQIGANVKFVSVEPFRERIVFSWPDLFNWYIIGGQSETSGEPARQPEWAWVEELLRQVRAVNAQMYWKPNLLARPREYPD